MKTQTLTEHVRLIAQEIWGEHWRPLASEILDIDMRTLQRIEAAAKAGEESPDAGEAFAAIEEFTVRVLKMVGAAHAALAGGDDPQA